MQKEETLERVTTLSCLANFLFDLFFVERTIFKMTSSPVISGPALILDALPRLEYVLEVPVEDLVVNDAALHIHNDGSRFQVSDLRAHG